MKKVVKKIEANAKKQMKRFSSDNELQKSLSSLNMLKGGLLMLIANQINKILPPENSYFSQHKSNNYTREWNQYNK